MDIAKRLNDLCNQRGLTGYRLAKLSGVPQAQLHQYMAGQKSPGIQVLEKICSGLDISISDFFSGDEFTSSESTEKNQRFDALHQLVDEVPEERREEVRRFIEFTIEQHKNKNG